MDFRYPEEIRIFGWALWRTIDLDPQGRTGPAKKKRTHIGHDERGTLGEKHLGQNLDIEPSNLSDVLKAALYR